MSRAAAPIPGREHIPRYPAGFIVLRILQFILSLIILGLCSYAVYVVAFSGDCLMLFTSLVTWIVTLWLICALSCTPRAYNYWAVLAFDIFLYVFWLISFATLAAQTAYYWAVGSGYCSTYSCYYGSLEGAELIFGSILAAASGLGAIQFLLFKISLIIHAVVVCRHRRAGHRSKPLKGTSAAPYQVQLQPQGKMAYQAVPQHGIPFVQDTAYNSPQSYNPPSSSHGLQGQQPQQQQQQLQQQQQQQPQQQTQGFSQQFPQQNQGQPPFYSQQYQQPAQQQQQQGFFPQSAPAPLVPQPTGGSFVQQTPTPPPQHNFHTPPPNNSMYQAPFPQPTPPPAAQGGYPAPAPYPASHHASPYGS